MPPLLRTWLQLLRAPNLFTVPGDPLAGYLLACYGAVESRIFLPVFASLFFYASGLLLNDLADFAEDRAERPTRPLPSGAASRCAATVVAVCLALAGLRLCAIAGTWTFGVGVALLLSIASYNLGSKRIPVIGALNMGLCRGLSLLLGATAVPHGDLIIRLMLRGRLDHLLVAFLLVTLFIAAVTNLARFETKSAVPCFAKGLPLLALVVGWFFFVPWNRYFPALQALTRSIAQLGSDLAAARWRSAFQFGNNLDPSHGFILAMLGFVLLSLLICTRVAWQLTRNHARPLPPSIGDFIRLLLVIQAAFCVSTSTELNQVGYTFAILLVLLWPISRAVGKRFYAS